MEKIIYTKPMNVPDDLPSSAFDSIRVTKNGKKVVNVERQTGFGWESIGSGGGWVDPNEAAKSILLEGNKIQLGEMVGAKYVELVPEELLPYLTNEMVEWTLKIPNGTTEIVDGAFKPVSDPSGSTESGSSGVVGLLQCTKVTIPTSVETIGTEAFKDFVELTSLTIPNSVSRVGSGVVQGCLALTDLKYPMDAEYDVPLAGSSSCGIKNILYSNKQVIFVPKDKSQLGENIVIPDGIEKIELSFGDSGSVSGGIVGIKLITVPDSVTSIDPSAFGGILNIIYHGSLTEEDGLPWGADFVNEFVDGPFVYSDNSKSQIDAIVPDLLEMTIPNSVHVINTDNYNVRGAVFNLIIPDSVTSISEDSFRGQGSSGYRGVANIEMAGAQATYGALSANGYIKDGVLYSSDRTELLGISPDVKNVEVLDSAITIPSAAVLGAFLLNLNVETVHLPEGLTVIPSNFLSECHLLLDINIPESVEEVGDNAFRDCDNLPVENDIRYADTIAVKYEGDPYAHNQITFKEGTKFICSSFMFDSCGQYDSINIPDGIKSIGQNAIQFGWVDDATITIPSSVEVVGAPFISCTCRNQELYLTFDSNACVVDTFNNLAALIGEAHLTIGDSITASIPLYYCSNNALLLDLTIGSQVPSIGEQAFLSCPNLTTVTIGNSVTNIGNDAFYGCSNLTTVTIGNSVISIRDRAFQGCSSLTSVTIPNSVTGIGELAFYNCYNLTELNYNGTQSDWASIELGAGWREESGISVIHCTDGDITL